MSINLHPATVHFPIAFLLLGSIAGLLYLFWQPHELLRNLTWWHLKLGWISTGIAILTGLFAQSGLPPQAPYRAILNWHISTGLAIWVLYGFILYRQWLYGKATYSQLQKRQVPRKQVQGRQSQTEPQPAVTDLDPELLNAPPARLWLTLLLLIGMLLIIASGWNGGRLVYVWAVNVTGF